MKDNKMNKTPFQWAVVGAGPAGIAAIGKLLDQGVPGKEIVWLDPYFQVGDLGQFWHNVSSNTTVQRFLDFLNACPSFLYAAAAPDFQLNHLSPNTTCILNHVVEPLQWISDHLRTTVHAEKRAIHNITLTKRCWSLHSETNTYAARQVILAQGAEARSLPFPNIEEIPFTFAIDPQHLKKLVNKNETYAVFGSSHSAVLVINYLVDLGVKKVINFYRSPCRYAIPVDDWILFDNTGLKGHAAAWAREHIDGILPHNVVRYSAGEANIARYMPECTKAIYAVGFQRRDNILINNQRFQPYNPHLGILGPGLFGLGIAYPELKSDPFGNEEYQVGLWKFMVYLNKIMPLWFKYHA